MRKATKEKANYRSHPHGAQRCALCTMFRPPHTCTAVAGEISPSGWCQFFKRQDMSEEKKEERSPVNLTATQKETARRLGMTEGEYGRHVSEGLKSGKIKKEHIH